MKSVKIELYGPFQQIIDNLLLSRDIFVLLEVKPKFYPWHVLKQGLHKINKKKNEKKHVLMSMK